MQTALLVKSYSNFYESGDFAYWWSFSGVGSAIDGDIPPSFFYGHN